MRPFLIAVLVLSSAGPWRPAAASDDPGRHRAREHEREHGHRGLPPGAKVVSPAEFAALLGSGRARLVGPAVLEQGKATQAAADRANLAVIVPFLATHPELASLHQLLAGSPVNGQELLAPSVGKEGHEETGHVVTTMSRSATLAALASSIRSTNDPASERTLYQGLYDRLPGAYLEVARLPAPGALEGATLADLRGVLKLLTGDRERLAGYLTEGPLVTRILGCGDEIGASRGWNPDVGDGALDPGARTPAADGILANLDFPTKGWLTCVKDQSHRGDCWAFATTSAVEMSVARDQGQLVNLSEQDLIEHYKSVWRDDPYHEGGDAIQLSRDVIANGYRFPFERDWDYNPSRYRNPVPQVYADWVSSCVSYPETCSYSASQAPYVCRPAGPGDPAGDLFECATLDAGIPGSPHTITAAGDSFWHADDQGLTLGLILLNLMFNQAVILGFNVTPEFQGAPANGFVSDLACLDVSPIFCFLENQGSHYVHVVGYVANEDLAARLPAAPPAAGGGYLIVKNSWGTGWGDAGYGYLPWDLVWHVGFQAFSIQGVE